MSWHYLLGQEEASWAGASLDGAPSALSSLIPTVAACCSHDNAMDACHGSLSGTTCAHSTELRGEVASMSSPEASHAKTFQRREEGGGSEDRGLDCGLRW